MPIRRGQSRWWPIARGAASAYEIMAPPVSAAGLVQQRCAQQIGGAACLPLLMQTVKLADSILCLVPHGCGSYLAQHIIQ
jgi:hypothetical protein